MKTPVILTRISCLLLATTWLPVSPAQDESNLSPTGSPTVRLSHPASEIVKLAQARIGESVAFAFITNSGAFNLSPDQLIRLKDLGVSAPIVTAMIQHDRELRLVTEPLATASKPDPQPVARALSASVDDELPTSVKEQSPPELALTVVTPRSIAEQPAASRLDEPVSPDLGNGSSPSQASKPNPYPVREPYPVELTAPIIMVQGAEITPNTFVIVGFPPAGR